MGDYFGPIFKTGAQNVVSRTFGAPYLKIYFFLLFVLLYIILFIFSYPSRDPVS